LPSRPSRDSPGKKKRKAETAGRKKAQKAQKWKGGHGWAAARDSDRDIFKGWEHPAKTRKHRTTTIKR
jgi:hypothetical protein